jgi:hypothetical protein
MGWEQDAAYALHCRSQTESLDDREGVLNGRTERLTGVAGSAKMIPGVLG